VKQNRASASRRLRLTDGVALAVAFPAVPVGESMTKTSSSYRAGPDQAAWM